MIKKTLAVAPGLGLGVSPLHSLYKEILDYYNVLSFLDNNKISGTVVIHITRILQKYGLPNKLIEPIDIQGIFIYPADYFCPMDSTTGIITITDNTYSIHHYDCSWINRDSLSFRIHLLKNYVNRLLGKRFADYINSIFH